MILGMISWMELLILAVLAIAVVLLMRSGHGWKIVRTLAAALMGLLLVSVVMLFATMLWRHSVAVSVRPASLGSQVLPGGVGVVGESETATPAEEPPGAAASLPGQQQLFSDLNGEFEADVYPSDAAAVRALAVQEAKGFGRLIPGGGDPERIEVCSSPEARAPQALLLEAANALQKAYPEAEVAVIPGPPADRAPSPKGKTVMVRVYVPVPTEPTFTPVLHIASVNMESIGAAGQVSRGATFHNKLWADDLAAFMARNLGHNWIVAMSSQPATSVEEAQDQAMAIAAAKLRPFVLERLRQLGMSPDRLASVDPQWLYQRIEAALKADQTFIRDRFVQRVQRSYGQIWQAAMLLDISPKAVADLADRCNWLLAIEAASARHTAMSVVGILVLVCLVYALLNALTRGYFVWSLRATALAAIVIGAFVVLMLRNL